MGSLIMKEGTHFVEVHLNLCLNDLDSFIFSIKGPLILHAFSKNGFLFWSELAKETINFSENHVRPKKESILFLFFNQQSLKAKMTRIHY